MEKASLRVRKPFRMAQWLRGKCKAGFHVLHECERGPFGFSTERVDLITHQVQALDLAI